jgi:hypothetical protein
VVRGDQAAGLVAAQVLRERDRGGVAVLRVQGHRPVGDRGEFAGDGRLDATQLGERAPVDAKGERRRIAAERRLAREHVVQDGAERIDIAALVDVVPASLLRGHVAQRAHDRAGLGHVGDAARDRGRIRLCFHVSLDLAGEVLGEAPVDHHGLAESTDEHVGGLQIAMDDVLLVGVGDRVGDGDHVLDQAQARRQGGRGGDLEVEALALDELHAIKRRARAAPAEIIKRDNAGVLEAGGDGGLERKAALSLRAVAQQLLDGDDASEPQILGDADDAEAARGEDLAEAIARVVVVVGADGPGPRWVRIVGRFVVGLGGGEPGEQAGLGAAEEFGGRRGRTGERHGGSSCARCRKREF